MKTAVGRVKPGPNVKSLLGRRCNTLVVMRYVRTKAQGGDGLLQMAMWECHCSGCGHLQLVQRRRLVSRTARCERCSRQVKTDLTGRRFGRLLVLGLSDEVGVTALWRVRCDCGSEKVVRQDNLRSGRTISCGCLRRQQPWLKGDAQPAEMADQHLVNLIRMLRGEGARGQQPPPDAAERLSALEAEAQRRSIDVAKFQVYRRGPDRPRARRNRKRKETP